MKFQHEEGETYTVNWNANYKSVMLRADFNLIYSNIPQCFGSKIPNVANQCPLPSKATAAEDWVKLYARVTLDLKNKQLLVIFHPMVRSKKY